MRLLVLNLVYFLFFLSGAAALIYEVLWVRSLSLIFGGTHLAVTTVLSVFMGGLALGSVIISKHIDGMKKPLRIYGILELCIALFAVAFMLLMKVYPSIYILLIQGIEDSRLNLTIVRVFFAFLALIVPSTLMGGTLPVLTRFVASHSGKLGTKLSQLYSFNTLGAVFGTGAAAFVLLRFFSVSTAFYTAIFINLAIGLLSILLSDRVAAILSSTNNAETSSEAERIRNGQATNGVSATINLLPQRLVLLGIGVSGFCALGYEVLWTRILTLTVGTSVYGFSIMLMAFLAGIALGSQAYGPFRKMIPAKGNETAHLARWFGVVQCLIGLAALAVTFFIRDLPTNSVRLGDFFQGLGFSLFHARQYANLTLAFSYMIVPAFFMGLAFPLAGKINMAGKIKTGQAVGSVLAFNTVGAILGSAFSGFFMIYVFGIERSLQLLAVINIGYGLLILASFGKSKFKGWAVAAATVAIMAFLILSPDAFRMWNARYFAIFQNNQPGSYSNPEKIQEAIDNTDVLFYHEGVDSTISAIKIKGGNQAVLVNGKVVASASMKDRQCQLTLGHLPMLFHKNPRKVLVVGLGTGMTLGATSIHPELEELTLAEIEPNVVGAARTFDEYNNKVLDNPKLKIIFNDGRNFLLTTKKKYDVITADPIHPWTQGSGYLYTAEYFKLAADHLLPGGIMCQWLPIYELSVDDLKSVVRTFSRNFKYTMTWMTEYDAEIIGSNSPIIIDENKLDQRLAHPAIAKDLAPVMMDSADDFLNYFVMGTEAMARFGQGAVINTDDNLYLEYSTPISLGKNLMGFNVDAIAQYRESILPYLKPAVGEAALTAQQEKWAVYRKAAMIADRAHSLFLDGRINDPEFRNLMAIMEQEYPSFSPGRFLWQEYAEATLRIPTLLDSLPLAFLNDTDQKVIIEISAVVARVSEERAALMFVDNAARKILGQRYFAGDSLDESMKKFAKDVMAAIETTYREEAEIAKNKTGQQFPSSATAFDRIEKLIRQQCASDKRR